jgi:hypothetical protein
VYSGRAGMNDFFQSDVKRRISSTKADHSNAISHIKPARRSLLRRMNEDQRTKDGRTTRSRWTVCGHHLVNHPGGRSESPLTFRPPTWRP